MKIKNLKLIKNLFKKYFIRIFFKLYSTVVHHKILLWNNLIIYEILYINVKILKLLLCLMKITFTIFHEIFVVLIDYYEK